MDSRQRRGTSSGLIDTLPIATTIPTRRISFSQVRTATASVVQSFTRGERRHSESTPPVTTYEGIYVAPGGVLELHKGYDGPLRGYLRTAERIAALSTVEIRDDTLYATLTFADSARSELRVPLQRGPALVVDGQEYRRTAVEAPAPPEIRQAIEEGYAELGKAV